MKGKLAQALFVVLLLNIVNGAIIDGFTTYQRVRTTGGTQYPVYNSNQITATEVIGGQRDVTVTMTSGAETKTLTSTVGYGVASLSAVNGVAGKIVYQYDGIDTSSTGASSLSLSPGLGGIDITSSVNSFRIVYSSDLPGASLSLAVYSSTTSAVCQKNIALDQVQNKQIIILFSDLTSDSSNTCSLTSVYAIQLTINILSTMDVEISSFSTEFVSTQVIDQFVATQSLGIKSLAPFPNTKYSNAIGGTAYLYGGERDLIGVVTAGANNVKLTYTVGNNRVTFVYGANVSSKMLLQYDGFDGNVNLNIPNGFIDLTLGFSASFQFTYNTNTAGTVYIRVYSASSTNVCAATVSVAVSLSDVKKTIDYASFSTGCSLSNANAIEFEFVPTANVAGTSSFSNFVTYY